MGLKTTDMKEITINNIVLQYKTTSYCTTDIDGIITGCYAYTEFYNGIEEYFVRKHWYSRQKIKNTRPKLVFTIHANSEDPALSKEWWRREIREKLALLNRKQEIERGELI